MKKYRDIFSFAMHLRLFKFLFIWNYFIFLVFSFWLWISISFMEFWTSSVARSSGVPDEKKFIWIRLTFNCFKSKDLYLFIYLWPRRCLQKRNWFFKISYRSDSFLLLPQSTSTSDADFNNPISWIECVRYFFWSSCFCNLIYLSNLAFSSFCYC